MTTDILLEHHIYTFCRHVGFQFGLRTWFNDYEALFEEARSQLSNGKMFLTFILNPNVIRTGRGRVAALSVRPQHESLEDFEKEQKRVLVMILAYGAYDAEARGAIPRNLMADDILLRAIRKTYFICTQIGEKTTDRLIVPRNIEIVTRLWRFKPQDIETMLRPFKTKAAFVAQTFHQNILQSFNAHRV